MRKNKGKIKNKKKIKNNSKKEDNKRIEIVKSVKCEKCDQLIAIQKCQQCFYHKDFNCFYGGKHNIEITSLGNPLRFNRSTSNFLSISERDSALNYYMPTQILLPTKKISKKEFPNYILVKCRFMRGDFKNKEKNNNEQEQIKIKSDICLIKTTDEKYDILFNGEKFKITDNIINDTINIVYYLYKMYSLDGFADIKIDNESYRVSLCKYREKEPDMIIGVKDNYLICGKENNK